MFKFRIVDQYNFIYWEGEDIEECEKFYTVNKRYYKKQGRILIIRWNEEC